MKFTINKELIIPVLDRIKKSNAIEKKDESLSAILIRATKDEIKIVATDTAVWAIGTVTKEDAEAFAKGRTDNDVSSYFKVETEGETYINGNLFINIISTYPEDQNICFELNCGPKNNEGNKTNSKFFRAYTVKKRGERSRKKTTDFVIQEVKFFQEFPIDEKREEHVVSAEDFSDAITSVQFASGSIEEQETDAWLWGCRTEIFEDGSVLAAATNRHRICYFGNKSKKGNFNVLFPHAKMLNPILKNFEPGPLKILAGERHIILEQKNQIYVVPSVGEKSDFESWKAIVEKIGNAHVAWFSVNRKLLLNCLKTSTETSGVEFGLRIAYDTDKKEIKFSAERIDVGSGFTKAFHEEIEPLDDDGIRLKNGSVNDATIINIEYLKDIVSRLQGEVVTIGIKDAGTPVIVTDENENLSCMISVLED